MGSDFWRAGRQSCRGRGREDGKTTNVPFKFFLVFNLVCLFFITCTSIFRLVFEQLSIINILIIFCTFSAHFNYSGDYISVNT